MHPEKRCTKCNQVKLVSEFVLKRSEGRRSSHCKECLNWNARSSYEKLSPKQKTAMLERVRRNTALAKKRLEQVVREHLTAHPCVDCGETNLVLLEFDHTRGVKNDSICRLMRRQVKVETLRKEIEKCDVRCVRCHRLKTASHGDWWRCRS